MFKQVHLSACPISRLQLLLKGEAAGLQKLLFKHSTDWLLCTSCFFLLWPVLFIYHPPPAARSDLNMESMLNKLKSTVTKVTADVTSAVMGNPVTREFEVGRHIASGGPGMCWRIYNGTKKSTKQVCVILPWSAQLVNIIEMNTQHEGFPQRRLIKLITVYCCLLWTLQEVAVFVFDKKIIDKYQKFEKDQIIDSLKKGVQQLTRLRHPRLLTVQHPLEESRWITHTNTHISRTSSVSQSWKKGLTLEVNIA